MKTIMLFLLFVMCISQTSNAQVTGAAALIALDEIDASISKQIQSIDNLVTNAIGNTGNMLLSTSARLRKDINETIGNTDKILRENQVSLFNELILLKNEYDDAIVNNLAALDNTATKVTEALTNFIVVRKEPSVFKFFTTPFIKGYSPSYTLKVSGKSFDKSRKVYALINGKQINPVQTTFGDLLFTIDSADIRTNDINKYYANAKIVFEWEKGLFGKDMISESPFIIPVTPLNIGAATAYYEQELPQTQYTSYLEYSCDCRTSQPGYTGGARDSSTSFNILPTGGRNIDIASIEVTNWDQRHGGGYHFNTKTTQQIAGNITCKSESRPFGARGTSHLTFRYKEFDKIYKVQQGNIVKDKITSVNPAVFELPDPIDGKRPNLRYIVVSTFDGKQVTLLPASSNKYFNLAINPVTDDVAITWR